MHHNLLGIRALDGVTAFSDRLNTLKDHLIVGHLPFLDRLLSLLTCGNKETGVFRFQDSGLVCLKIDQSSDGRWNGQILWMLNPRVR